ncbi:MAG TPA: hypothetical protein VLB29_07240 [Nocardioidaceae bacterium]|nr:hypothetical protein [Nocardioidaceae bacterium]
MDLSGIIFVILAVAWAVYLIPKALKHHDEVARTRSVDRFSTAMRVLARREPVDPRNARLVVTPPRPTERVLIPSRPAQESTRPASRRNEGPRRAAARAAARRRRHVTLTLVGTDLVMVTLASFAIVPWWTVAIPVALTVLYLVLCRSQVRRENSSTWAPVARQDAETAPRRAVRVDSAYGAKQQQDLDDHQGYADEEDTVAIPVAELETVAVPLETDHDGSLWDPLPVTLPTYVNKAKAARTVRTIDLGAPGTWTSGRDEADSALVEQAATPEPVEEEVEHEPRRAVGS